jgi:hypothetical protein
MNERLPQMTEDFRLGAQLPLAQVPPAVERSDYLSG